jgi:hypothetical protein
LTPICAPDYPSPVVEPQRATATMRARFSRRERRAFRFSGACAINGWATDRCPRLVHGDIEAPNLAALGDYISKLKGAGMELFPDNALENHLLRVAGLPKRASARAAQEALEVSPSTDRTE